MAATMQPTSPSSGGRRPRWSATPTSPRPSCCSTSSPTRWSRSASPGPTSTSPASGSCDYITGQAFSFVPNLDAIGAWPPKRDSHVEMDGAWALYEAWLRLQEGDIEIAVVTGSGRSSTGDPALIYPMEMDPYYLAARRRPADLRRPPGPSRHRRRHRRRAVDGRGRPSRTPTRRQGRRRATSLLAGRLRARAAAPPRPAADHRRRLPRWCSPPADRARQLVERPAWITGFDHRTECHNPAFRASTTRRRPASPARRPASPTGRSRSPSCRRPSPTRSPAAPRARPRRRRQRQPVGRPLRRQPDHGDRPGPHRLRRRPHLRRAAPAARPLDVGPACNRT